MKICKVCQSAAQWKPDGFNAKTHKPFKGFWSCPNWKTCGPNTIIDVPDGSSTSQFNSPATQQYKQPQQNYQPVAQPKPVTNGNQENIDWSNAKNNACLLIANHPFFKTSCTDEESIVRAISRISNIIFELKRTQKTDTLEENKKFINKFDVESGITEEEIPF
jgi:hypothetical protein